MMFNNVFNFGFSASIKDTNLEQFLSVIFCFACSFMSMSQSLFPSLYGTANFLAFVSLPWSFVSDDEDDDEDDSVVAVEAEEDKTILTHFFCRLPRDVDVPCFPFDDKEEEEEREGTEEKGARIAAVAIVVVVVVALFLSAFKEFWIKDASSLQNGIKSIFFFSKSRDFFCLCHLSSVFFFFDNTLT